MPLVIDYETMRALGGKDVVDAQVAAFQKALVDHATTVDVPAPSAANAIVEAIVRQYGGEYTAEEPPPEPPEPPPPSMTELVSVERERRLSLGCTVTLSSGQGPIPVQTRDEVDHRNLLTLESQAMKAVISGAPQTQFFFRDAQDHTWTLTALEMMDMTAKVAAFGSGIFAKSWALKAMDPIPSNYQADEWWA